MAIAAATFVGAQPAAEDQRRGETVVAPHELPVDRRAGAAGDALDMRVEQVEVRVEGRRRLQVGARAHTRRLDELRARPACDLGAERRPLVAVELDVRVSPVVCVTASISSSVALTKTPTMFSVRRSAAPMTWASASSTRRGEPSQKIIPSAQAPASAASWASSSVVMPQCLMRVAMTAIVEARGTAVGAGPLPHSAAILARVRRGGRR